MINSNYDYYKVILKTKGPVYIGSGLSLSKKEYIWDSKKIIIPSFEKMYMDIRKRKLEAKFQAYMLEDKSYLERWLKDNGFTENDYKKWTKYELDCKDARIERGKSLEIKTFMKDAYGKPYIPGSSLKGLIRTVLLANDILKYDDKYAGINKKIKEKLEDKNNKNIRSGKGLLSYENSMLETKEQVL